MLLARFSLSLVLLSWAVAAQAQTTPPLPITNTATATQLLRQPGVVVLDVRTPAEYQGGHLPQAQNLDFRAPDFATHTARLDTAQDLRPLLPFRQP